MRSRGSMPLPSEERRLGPRSSAGGCSGERPSSSPRPAGLSRSMEGALARRGTLWCRFQRSLASGSLRSKQQSLGRSGGLPGAGRCQHQILQLRGPSVRCTLRGRLMGCTVAPADLSACSNYV